MEADICIIFDSFFLFLIDAQMYCVKLEAIRNSFRHFDEYLFHHYF